MININRQGPIWEFCAKWCNKGKEDADDRIFWIDILQQVLGISNATNRIEFQKKVFVNGNTKKIDAYIPETKVLIEQKSNGISLDKKILQSDGALLTPYEQAKRYNDNLPLSEKARWIITSNFSEFWIYDMDTKIPVQNLTKISILDLLQNSHLLNFLLSETNKDLNIIDAKHLNDYKIVTSIEFIHALLRSNDFLNSTHLQQKFLFLVLSGIKHDWHKTIYDNVIILNLSDIIEKLNWGLTQNRRNARCVIKRELDYLKNHSSVSLNNNFLTKTAYVGNIITNVSYSQELVTIEINTEIIPHLLTDILLSERIPCLQISIYEILNFDSKFSLPLYLELLFNKKKDSSNDTNTYFIELVFLKKLLGLDEDSYVKYKTSEKNITKVFNSSTFEQRTLCKAIDDINNKCSTLKLLSYDDEKFFKRTKSKNTIIGYEFKYVITV